MEKCTVWLCNGWKTWFSHTSLCDLQQTKKHRCTQCQCMSISEAKTTKNRMNWMQFLIIFQFRANTPYGEGKGRATYGACVPIRILHSQIFKALRISIYFEQKKKQKRRKVRNGKKRNRWNKRQQEQVEWNTEKEETWGWSYDYLSYILDALLCMSQPPNIQHPPLNCSNNRSQLCLDC